MMVPTRSRSLLRRNLKHRGFVRFFLDGDVRLPTGGSRNLIGVERLSRKEESYVNQRLHSRARMSQIGGAGVLRLGVLRAPTLRPIHARCPR
jgi:hypothetical protein